MKVIDHRLYGDHDEAYPFRPSPNTGGKVLPELLVIHYTAGRSAAGSVEWLARRESKASAHVVIGRDGGITQLVPFDTVAWHAGDSAWGDRRGLNRYSLGIELDNAGRLTRHGDRWRAWFGDEYDEGEVILAAHKHETEPCGWQVYPPAQIEAALDMACLLIDGYGLRDVVGHEDIAPGRKTDPGPAFPMASFHARVLGRAEDEPERYETTTALNIRSGPGTQHGPLQGSPLPPDKPVEVLSKSGSWWLVDVPDEGDMQGWVHSRYLRRMT